MPTETPPTTETQDTSAPIKVPNPPEGKADKLQPEVPKTGSRDAPGG
jgi:hypothetical protein